MAARTSADREATEIGAALLAVARVMNQVRTHDTLCKQAGVQLDRGGSAVLYKLYAEGENIRITDLAERLGIDPPAVTRKVQQLERVGLLSRSTDPDDGRACRVRLTRQGRNSIDRLLGARESWLAEMLEGWRREDKKDFARLMLMFASTMSQDKEDRRGL